MARRNALPRVFLLAALWTYPIDTGGFAALAIKKSNHERGPHI
jgi:hypothetical protein